MADPDGSLVERLSVARPPPKAGCLRFRGGVGLSGAADRAERVRRPAQEHGRGQADTAKPMSTCTVNAGQPVAPAPTRVVCCCKQVEIF